MTPAKQVTIQKSSMQKIKKRDGRTVPFDSEKIKIAIKKAFASQGPANDSVCQTLTDQVVNLIQEKFEEQAPTVEDVQDLVETVLILSKYTKVAKAYILYRSRHDQLRKEKTLLEIKQQKLMITNAEGKQVLFDAQKIRDDLQKMSHGLTKISIDSIVEDVTRSVYNGMKLAELRTLIVSVTKAKIEDHYSYSALSSRLLLNELYKDILNVPFHSPKLKQEYQNGFKAYLNKGIDFDLISPELKTFDLDKIAKAINSDSDLLFYYLGVHTLFDRYLLRERKDPKVFELPQWMWMRIAMGLALAEKENREERAIEFYKVLSEMYFVSSTPTLFNSGTTRSQMSSCFLNTVDDSLHGIFKTYADNAQLCKWAGAVGTDWTPVRSKGAKIIGTNGASQGTIPFIKIFNDVALAVNQGGKRKGALAAYMEVWHADIEEFLELKKNTGDERRRAHDIHTAAWIPDLFMKRVKENGTWTLFTPDSVPGLHDKYGKEFEKLYEKYEQENVRGAKTVNAADLWRKMLTMLFETGHPWITFKDPSNIRSPQDHVGVVHASNLCTEITLNTSKEETAVCNLGSLNLAKFIKNGDLNKEVIERVVMTAVRMLNDVIDVNFYTIPETKNSNMKHRPIGLGLMGYHDALYQLGIDFDSEENLDFADKSMEMISYYALLASSKLAKEQGAYPSYPGSKWDRGILPLDSVDLLEKERGQKIQVNRKSRMDWGPVREHIKKYGMRNSNVMAIAPTATISNIAGVIPCVEPIFKNIYMKENMSGNYIVINTFLIDALDEVGLWNKEILTKIKVYNGSVLNIDEVPAEIRRRFKETFEIDPSWLINAAALRAKWIDQSASTNLFLRTTNGKAISDAYMMAWETGLKTTYYLRTLAASQVTKSIENVNKEEPLPVVIVAKQAPKVCPIEDPSCESCQ